MISLELSYFGALGVILIHFLLFKKKYFSSLFFYPFILFFFTYFANQKLVGYDGIAAVFQTDITEAVDFISDNIFFPRRFYIVFTVFALGFFFIRFTPQKIRITHSIAKKVLIIMSLISAYPFFTFSKNLGTNIYNSYKQFKKEQEKFNNQNTAFKDIISEAYKNNIDFVLYLGESTGKWNIGHYNYPRDTFKVLKQFKDDLIFYSDVISPHSHTAPSLSQVLSTKKFDPILEENEYENSIIQLLNNSKVKTYWYSTQNKFGFWENPVTRHATLAQESFFYRKSFGIDYTKRYFDHRLVAKFKSSYSNDDKNSRFYLIHTYAGHGSYCGNIPDEYHQNFNDLIDRLPTKAIWGNFDKPNRKQLNCYDNALRYIAKNISDTVKIIKNSTKPTIFLYTPDHGEDTWNNSSHGSSNHSHKHLEIPFIWFFNDAAKKAYPEFYSNIIKNKDKAYNIGNLSNDIINIFGIETPEYKSQFALTSINFKEEQRYVLPAGDNHYVSYDTNTLPKSTHTDMKDSYSKDRVFLESLNSSVLDTLCAENTNTLFKIQEGKSLFNCLTINLDDNSTLIEKNKTSNLLNLVDILMNAKINQKVVLNITNLSQNSLNNLTMDLKKLSESKIANIALSTESPLIPNVELERINLKPLSRKQLENLVDEVKSLKENTKLTFPIDSQYSL